MKMQKHKQSRTHVGSALGPSKKFLKYIDILFVFEYNNIINRQQVCLLKR